MKVECEHRQSKYKQIVKCQKDQFKLKLAGGMTDRSWICFCRDLKQISRYVIHHGSLSMNNNLADQIHDFTAGTIHFIEKDKKLCAKIPLISQYL